MIKSDEKTHWIQKRYKLNRLIWQQFLYFMENWTPQATQDIRPLRIKYIMTIIVFAFYVITFVVLCYDGWNRAYYDIYLVPAEEVSSSTSQVCTVGPESVSSYDFMIDRSGSYEGSSGFSFTQAVYQFEFNNVDFTNSQYISYMKGIQYKTNQLGVMALNYSLSMNLLHMYTYMSIKSTVEDDENNEVNQYFYYVSSMENIIDPSTSPWFYLRNKDYQCNTPWNAYYIPSSVTLGFSFNLSQYVSNPNCQNVVDGSKWVFRAPSNSPSYNTISNAQFDVRSFMVALAVNLNIYNHDTCGKNINRCLQKSSKSYNETYNNETLTVSYYIDVRFENMKNVPCIYLPNSTNDFKLSCFVQFQGSRAVPVFNNLPYNSSYLSQLEFWINRCACDVNGLSDACNEFLFSLALIMYNTPFGSTPNEVYSLLIKYSQGNYYELIEQAYNATLPPNVPQTEDNFKFCYDETSGLTCSIAGFIVDNFFRTVNKYQYNLDNGSCANIFSVDATSWDNILSAAPYDLTKDYASCHKTSEAAFFDASGIAFANTFTLVPLFASILASLYIMYLCCSNPDSELEILQLNAEKLTFPHKDQRRAVEIIADQMLKEMYIRKYGSSHGIEPTKSETMKNLVDVLEMEMSEYSKNSQYINSTVETFGYVMREDSPVDVANPIKGSIVEMKDRENDRSSSTDMRNMNGNSVVVPGFELR